MYEVLVYTRANECESSFGAIYRKKNLTYSIINIIYICTYNMYK